MQFSFVDLILKKRRGEALKERDINAFVWGAAHQTVPDYQLSALLMAICLRGMTDEETLNLTLAIAHSGATLDLTPVGAPCVDKHSTGGVGDTTTLILAPLVAACGGKVAKISGRGLGHTGGTLDKLESIPGMRVDLSMDAFIEQVRRVGCAVVGQTADLAPADRTLYALRDVTGTVESLPLIVSSIMSKKLASGCGAIVLDVKTGSGAIMHSLEDSIALARAMVEVGRLAKRPTQALVTGMEQPLGTHVGNALEVKEAIDALSGRARGRLLEISLRLGAMMLVSGGVAQSEDAARAKLRRALQGGKGLEKLAQMIEAQGGNPRVCEDTGLLPQADRQVSVLAKKGGFVRAMDAALIGAASQALGAGRVRKTDDVDPAVGLVMQTELGARVEAGDPLAILHVREGKSSRTREAASRVLRAIEIGESPAPVPPLAYAVVREGGVERLS